MDSAAPKTSADARLLEAVGAIIAAGWAASERGLALELGVPPAIFYKIRTGVQSYGKGLAAALEYRFGVAQAYLLHGRAPMFSLQNVGPLGTEGEDVWLRARLAALHKGLTAEAFAKAVGVEGLPKTPLSTKQIARLQRELPGLQAAWLLTAQGLPFLQPGGPKRAPIGQAVVQGPVGLVMAPFVSLPARAGFVASYAEGTTYAHLERQPVLLDAALGQLAGPLLFEVEGDSMYPTLQAGDKVITAPVSQSNWLYAPPGLYVVAYGDEYLVAKRINRNTLAQGYVELYSDNADVPPVRIPADELRGLFTVRQLMRVVKP